MIHELKLRKEFFDYVRFGMKKFEIRKDDCVMSISAL